MQIGYVNPAAPDEYLSGQLLYSVGRSEDAVELGQVVEAEVLFASGETANVRLSNGAILRARLEGGAALTEGETVLLCVKANDGNSLVLQLITNPSAGEGRKTPAELIGQTGLRNTQLNQLLAAALADSRLPVEAELIRQSGDILGQYPDTSVQAAVFAAANGLEPNAQNLGVVDALLRADFKVSDLLARIFSLLDGTSVSNTPRPPSAAAAAANAGPSRTPAENADAPGVPGQAGVQDGGRGNALSGQDERMTDPASANGAADDLQKGPDNSGIPIIKEANTKNERPSAAAGDDGRPAGLPGHPDGETLSAGTGIASVEGSRGELKAAQASFFAKVEKPEDAAALKQAGERLLGNLELLRNGMDTRSDAGKSAAAEADRLIGGLKLMEAIDRFSYMQIPVMTGGRPSTVDVYVFNKKKGVKKTNPEATTVLLALDTENLGPVEALVTIKKSDISIRFNLRDERIADYFRSRTVALYNMVSAAGQRLGGVQYQAAEQPATPLTAPKAAEQFEAGLNRKINVRV